MINRIINRQSCFILYDMMETSNKYALIISYIKHDCQLIGRFHHIIYKT